MNNLPASNANPIYDLCHRLLDGSQSSQRLYFLDQAQADSACYDISNLSGEETRLCFLTLYGWVVVDVSPGVFIGMFPHVLNAKVGTHTDDGQTG